MFVKPKKHLGQHFLTDTNIARKIADSCTDTSADITLEIGGGTGILTDFFIEKPNFFVTDIDSESIAYLKSRYSAFQHKILFEDFLDMNISERFPTKQIAVIGNFPYNISSQILFKAIENQTIVTSLTGMFQKEVAERIGAKHGSKVYGILSVLAQVFYDAEYLFTVSPEVFNPPPKVQSGVIRLTRKAAPLIASDIYPQFATMVKAAFNQRRKMLSNSLSAYFPDRTAYEFLTKRPEQLSVKQFVEIFELVRAK